METLHWTREQIYRSAPNNAILPPRLKDDWKATITRNYPDFWTPEFHALLEQETHFLPMEQVAPTLTEAQIEEIVANPQSCPHCWGTHTRHLESIGQVTGIVVQHPFNCVCKRYADIYSIWNDPINVPTRFRNVNLATLEPSPKSSLPLEHQLVLIQTIRERPHDNYFLYGSAGTGKTHLMTALYRTAVERWVDQNAVLGAQRRAVFRVTASVLLDQHVAAATHSLDSLDTVHPVVTADILDYAIKDGYHVSLFIDEIDKICQTAFKLIRLNQLVDKVWSADGQVVATSNKSVDNLMKQMDTDLAGTLLRRFGLGEGAHTLDFDHVMVYVAGVDTSVTHGTDPTEADPDVRLNTESGYGEDLAQEVKPGASGSNKRVERTPTTSATKVKAGDAGNGIRRTTVPPETIPRKRK